MPIARLMTFLCLLFAASTAFAGDPHPPLLNVSFLAQPSPIVQNGETRLFYEMLITNFSKNSYVLDAIEARAGDTQTKISGATLSPLILHLGAAAPNDERAAHTIQAGRSVIVFLALDLGKSSAPGTIAQTLHVLADRNERHDIVLAPLPVAQDKPIVVAPPLRGQWIAGDSVNNLPDAAHRRAVLIDDGHAWLAQRFAIDWVQIETVNGAATTFKGPEDKNESYFCYDQPIYSVAPGKVVEASDGMAENVPHSGKYAVAIDFNNAAGNHVVVEIAPHRYVLYAHMRPGTVQVKPGDRVRTGQVLGHVGNTGSSTEPHLHMHIDDQPSFLAGNGVPYEFTEGEASGPIKADVSSPTAIHLGPIGPEHPFKNDYPAVNALVTFK
jgi:Peptidase family M23